MGMLNDVSIYGSLNVKDKITITEDDIDFVFNNNDNIFFGDEAYNLKIQSKKFEVDSKDDVKIYTDKDYELISEQDINLTTDNIINLNSNRIKLRNSRTIYGTQDPNDMDLSDIDEGTLYFRVLND